MVDLLERGVVDKVKKRFESTGWLHRKVIYQGRRGAPDDWFFGANGRLVIIEFKRPKKDAEKQQKREHARLIELGFEVYLIDTIEKGYEIHARLERRNKFGRLL